MKQETKLEIRDANQGDLKLFFRWGNDAETRAMSLNSDPIHLETHQSWYQQALDNPAHYVWVLESEGAPVGSVRFEQQAGSDFLISIQIDPNFRKRGFGTRGLKLAIEYFKTLKPNARVLASIKRENRASFKIFSALGFQKVKTEGLLDHYELYL